MIEKIRKSIVGSETTIIQSLKKMDEIKSKILYVFDGEHFSGLITIGDIQRAIIHNVQLDCPISNIIHSDKVYASDKESIDQIKEKMHRLRAESMPVVNSKGELVDVFLWNELFSEGQESVKAKIDLPVIIMAGGLGTRLRPLTNVIPKPLIPINDKTILEIIMDQFQNIGCQKFFLSVNYKYDIIEYYINNLKKKYDISYFKEEKPLGTIGSVSLLKGKIHSPFFVTNCDILIDQDYRDVYEYHRSSNNEITVVTSIKSYPIPYGVIETGPDGLLSKIVEKPEKTYMINTGVYLLNQELIDEIPSNQFYHITDLIRKVKARKGKIGCFPVSEKSWSDIGDWDEYLKLIKR